MVPGNGTRMVQGVYPGIRDWSCSMRPRMAHFWHSEQRSSMSPVAWHSEQRSSTSPVASFPPLSRTTSSSPTSILLRPPSEKRVGIKLVFCARHAKRRTCFFRVSTKACAGVAQEQKALVKRRATAEEVNCVPYAGKKRKLPRRMIRHKSSPFFEMIHPLMVCICMGC